MEESWSWWTRRHDNAAVFALLFNGQNHDQLSRIPDAQIESDMFAEVRIACPPNPPQFAAIGDFITWESGCVIVWNKGSFINAHTIGKPSGRKLGSKDAGSFGA